MNQAEVGSLVQKLCTQILANADDSVRSRAVEIALRSISRSPSSTCKISLGQEFTLLESTKRHLAHQGREKEALVFMELYSKLKESRVLRNRASVIALLHSLKDSSSSTLAANAGAQRGLLLPRNVHNLNGEENESAASDHNSTASAIPRPSQVQTRPARPLRAFEPGIDSNASTHYALLREVIFALQGIEGQIIRLSANKDGFRIDERVRLPLPVRKKTLSICDLGCMYMQISKFCEVRRKDYSIGLMAQALISSLQSELVEYYRLLALFESQHKTRSRISQADTPMEDLPSPSLTLHRLAIWTLEPRRRLAGLATLVEECRNAKGGALISTIFHHTCQGDPGCHLIVQKVLGTVSKPFFMMMKEWILSGSLEDSHNEFFVSVDHKVLDMDMWNGKYQIRQTMVPSFLTRDQAQMILTAGKSLRFLREVCNDSSPIPGHSKLSKLIAFAGDESLFAMWENGHLQEAVSEACAATSKHLLRVMMDKYQLMAHFNAFRKYLLLSQGDFAFSLLEIMTPELSKPITAVFTHTLAMLLETAIRTTNAQYDEPEILRRLDVRLDTNGKTGWDGFALDYRIDGPLNTIASPEMKADYKTIFKFLWRAKHVESLLSKLWRRQAVAGRILNKLPETIGMAHHAHLLLSQMIHFVQQMAYYITFEVLACTWETLSRDLRSAQSLDDVIVAHKHFLESTAARALLDTDTPMFIFQLEPEEDPCQEGPKYSPNNVADLSVKYDSQSAWAEGTSHLRHNLQSLYSGMIVFGDLQQTIFKGLEDEYELRREFEKQQELTKKRGEDGPSHADIKEEKTRRENFYQNFVMKMKTKLRLLGKSYEDKVQDFLLALSSHPDPSLQQLSFRLDFNDFYHRKNGRLSMSMTFQARRQIQSKSIVQM